MAVVRGLGEAAVAQRRSPEGYEEAIGSMLEEIDRMTNLVETLLRLSQGDADTIRLSREPVDLGQLARDVAASLGILAEERNQRLTLDITDGVVVSADRLVLREALTNVLDNAIKYSPVGSRVALRVERSRDEAVLAIEDEGPGIAPEHRERVFHRFFRVDEARSRDRGGAGLGLAIAKWAVEIHGGKIAVNGSARGRFRIPNRPAVRVIGRNDWHSEDITGTRRRIVMKRFFTALAAVSSLAIGTTSWGQDVPSEYQQVLTTLGKQGDYKANVLKVNIPRNDLSVTVANVKTPTPFGFGGWVAMTKGTGGMDVMMGDLVLTAGRSEPGDVRAARQRPRRDGAPQSFLLRRAAHVSTCTCTGTERPRISRAKLKPALDLIGKAPVAGRNGRGGTRCVRRQDSTRRSSRRSSGRKANRPAPSTRSRSAATT